MRTIMNIFRQGSIVTILLLAVSCNDVMDTKPFDKFSEDVVWETRTGVDAFIYSTYQNIMDIYIQYAQEEQYTPNAFRHSYISLNHDEVTRDDDFGFNRFDRIRRCNLIIEKVATSTGISDAEKTELIAEGKFLRATIYYYLARRFGIVVWVDHTLTAEEENYQLPTTKDAAETYGYIVKDLNEAIADLPETSLSGRTNRYAAYALLSEVCLQAAAYTGDQSYYQKSIDAADAVINSGKYTMETDYAGMFNEGKPYSPEIILGRYRKAINTNCNDIYDLQQTVPNVKNLELEQYGCSPLFKSSIVIFEAWHETGPTQNLADEYEVIDELTGEAVRWDESSQFKAHVKKETPDASVFMVDKGVTDGIPINDVVYTNRDNRFYATLVYDSCEWFGELVTMCEKGNLVHDFQPGYWGTTLSDYYWRKGTYNASPRVYVGIPTDYHWVLFRLGRVYLNKAEALLQQQKIQEALEALNQTRVIHGGMPPATASTVDEAWKIYKRERRVDLAKEGDYYWSLLRWGKIGGPANAGRAPGGVIEELTIPPMVFDLSKDRTRYSISHITKNRANEVSFDSSKRYLFPIPQSQRNMNPNLGQNPGYN